MKRRTVLSMEQALSLPYATLRFVQLGWRVIRIEAAPTGKGLPGDPNRYIGSRVFDDDRRSYFIAPNVGKEAIALDLKSHEGHAILRSLIRELDVDVFCCNTLPSRYKMLGIDYASLAAVKPDLIWAGISAMGPEYPDVPGYDPGVQAMAGYMELTGDAAGPPTLAGVPIIDLKAGDELFAHVCLALAERAETGKGKEIHVSMLQAAASWLITTLPLLDFDCDPSEVTRCGNEHRKFVPTNAYPTRDGFVLVAIGNDIQWQRLCAIQRFAALASPARDTMEGRTKERQALHHGIAAVTAACTTAELVAELRQASIVHAVINTIPQVRTLPAIDSRLTTTHTPAGQRVRMQPPAVDIAGAPTAFRFPPSYGEHTRAVLREAGCTEAELAALSKAGTIAG